MVKTMLIEYHIIFMILIFILFIISILLLFIDVTLEKAIAANIFTVVNFILCAIVSLGFGAINAYGYDANGVIVNNIYSDMYYFIYIFWAMGYINVMILFYCVYMYYRKPWEQFTGESYENEKQYRY